MVSGGIGVGGKGKISSRHDTASNNCSQVSAANSWGSQGAASSEPAGGVAVVHDASLLSRTSPAFQTFFCGAAAPGAGLPLPPPPDPLAAAVEVVAAAAAALRRRGRRADLKV